MERQRLNRSVRTFTGRIRGKPGKGVPEKFCHGALGLALPAFWRVLLQALRGRLRSPRSPVSDEAERPVGGSGREQPFLEARHVDSAEPGLRRRLRRRAGPERRAVRPARAPDPAGQARGPAAHHRHAPAPRRAVLPGAHRLPVAPPAAPARVPALADGLRLHAGVRGRGRVGEHPPPPRDDAARAGGPEPSPSAVIVDTQSVKTTEKGGPAATTRPRRSRAGSGTSGSTPRACCSA